MLYLAIVVTNLVYLPIVVNVTSLVYLPIVVTSLVYLPIVVTSLVYLPIVVTSVVYLPIVGGHRGSSHSQRSSTLEILKLNLHGEGVYCKKKSIRWWAFKYNISLLP